jgi:hypothetical protein
VGLNSLKSLNLTNVYPNNNNKNNKNKNNKKNNKVKSKPLELFELASKNRGVPQFGQIYFNAFLKDCLDFFFLNNMISPRFKSHILKFAYF